MSDENGEWWDNPDPEPVPPPVPPPQQAPPAQQGQPEGYHWQIGVDPDGKDNNLYGGPDSFGWSNDTNALNAFSPNMALRNIPGFQQFMAQMEQGWNTQGKRQAFQINQGPQDQFRQGQMQLMQQLMQQANGQGPSLAQMQLQRAGDQNMQQAMSMAASQRGQNAGGAMRQLSNQRAQIGSQQAADSGMLRLQEQMAAQNMLGQVSGQARGQDIGLATNQAQIENQQRAMNDQAVQFYLRSGMDLSRAQQQAAADMEKLRIASNVQSTQLRQADADRERQQQSDWLNFGAKLLGGIGSMGGGGGGGGGG